jgi:predicted alpha/beta superfamily hydrolase
LIARRLIEPLIIVAVANVGDDRIHEYAPTRGLIDPDEKRRRRSRGALENYGMFLRDELKPFIDRAYRTQPEAEWTGLAGSSLGGLATLALGLWFPNLFNRLAVLSPSVWWDRCAIYGIIEEVEEKPPLKIWLDTGTHEQGWERARELRDRLIEKGWRLYDDLQYTEAKGADHSEAAWGARIGDVLRFLYPKRRRSVVPGAKKGGTAELFR